MRLHISKLEKEQLEKAHFNKFQIKRIHTICYNKAFMELKSFIALTRTKTDIIDEVNKNGIKN